MTLKYICKRMSGNTLIKQLHEHVLLGRGGGGTPILDLTGMIVVAFRG